MKIKILISVLILTIIIISCKDDNNNVDNFDHAGQSLLDDETIKEYLETHFYTSPTASQPFGVIDTIAGNNAGEVPIMNLVTTQLVNFNDIDYNLYYLKNLPEGIATNPSRVDSVLVKYKGSLIDYVSDTQIFDERTNYTWLLLSQTITGWGYGFTNYKSGNNISVPDMPLEYENTGKGVLFIPSGLAYRNLGTATIPSNAPILFHIDLGQVEEADHDLDTVSSNYENLNNDDDYTNDDTDGDDIPNYTDIDDDGDNLLTKYENADPNGDGNPSDALDTDNDNIPNYLDDDDDGDGILTENENADPNGDGNPEDAEDTDGDNIPDYLDAD